MAGAAQGVAQIFTAATLHTLTGEDPPAFATLGQWVVATGDVARLRGMSPGRRCTTSGTGCWYRGSTTPTSTRA